MHIESRTAWHWHNGPFINLEFEHKLKNCLGLSDVRKLVHKSPEKNLKLLDESFKPCTQLNKDQFSHLQLKGVLFQVPEEASDGDINELFKSLKLDKSAMPYDWLPQSQLWAIIAVV